MAKTSANTINIANIIAKLPKYTDVDIYHIQDEYKQRYSGFTHVSTFGLSYYQNGNFCATHLVGKACWCNRTWESYRFKTSRCNALYDAIESRRDYLKRFFLQQIGKQRLSPKCKPFFEQFCNADTLLQEFQKAYEKVKTHQGF